MKFRKNKNHSAKHNTMDNNQVSNQASEEKVEAAEANHATETEQTASAQTEVTDNAEEQTTEATDVWKDKYDEVHDNHLRLQAEFDNYRKRTMREKADIIKNAGERVLTDFLPIIDNFERALISMQSAENVDAVREGVELIYSQVMNMMKNNGVTVIETENQPFDTEYHEAITTIPAPTPDMKDKIIDCTTRGYMMNEKVIRHAKVVVGA